MTLKAYDNLFKRIAVEASKALMSTPGNVRLNEVYELACFARALTKTKDVTEDELHQVLIEISTTH